MTEKQEEEKQRLHKMTRSDAENDLEREGYNQEGKDDWGVNDNDNMNENDINIIVPSFIHLFAIRRILHKYIKNNKDKKKDKKEEIIKELATVFKENKENELLVINTLTRLINDGIKKYMSKYYNEKKQANIVEDIFNKIILEKFSQEYNEMIKYGINDEITKNNYYKNLLFNSIDLMNQIFQYLEWGWQFNGDLFECSLVSSHWLYHVWNVNSVYYIDFQQLAEDYSYEYNRKWRRTWQRLYNVKSVKINLTVGRKATTPTVNKLSMLRKVEKVDVYVTGGEIDKCISALRPIMSRCKDRIKYCQIEIYCHGFSSSHYSFNSSSFEVPSPLRLPQAQYVEIGDLYFYRQWTNECTQLRLSSLRNISKDWCQFVIENCDCSNITNLILEEITFAVNNNSINKVILQQFALKFYNLKTLEMVLDVKADNNVLLFWQLLKPIISKNKTKVKLEVRNVRCYEYKLLSQRMNEKDLKIEKLIIGDISLMSEYDTDKIINLIQERDNRGLNHLAFGHTISDRRRHQKWFHYLKCKSITTFELKHDSIKFVNSLLEWKMIREKQLFIIIDVYKNDSNYDNINNGDKDFSLFKKLYENVHQLFAQQIALDIKIKFSYIKNSKVFQSHLSLYSSYFENSQFLSKYKSPKCNSNLCLPRSKPYTYFRMNDSKLEYEWQRYLVFGASNVQMK